MSHNDSLLPDLPPAPQTRGRIELTGIEIVNESERTAKPRNLFLPWFASNISVFGMSYGAWVLGFGISFWQATIVAVIGAILSFAICGVIALGGKRGSVPTMVMSRSAFGVQGAKVPGVISWLTSIGWVNWPGFSSDLYTRMELRCQANTIPNFVSVRFACSPRPALNMNR